MTEFKQRVISFVNRIPKGKVASYGQVAAAAGNPNAARQVGGILRALDISKGLPWWRVLNNQGIISIKGNWTADKKMQALLLKKDGIKIEEGLRLDMAMYRFKDRKV